jgi:hypothetical protein
VSYETKLRVSLSTDTDMNFQVAGARGGAVVEALRYKPEGRGIDSRWCHWNFFIEIIIPATL